jgi:hypothetical protein
VLHPLPRVSELGYELDRDPRGVYFKQAGYGVPVRMALIAKVLGIVPFGVSKIDHERRSAIHHFTDMLVCPNAKCVTNSPIERRYLSNQSIVLPGRQESLRCWYCDTSIAVGFVGHTRTKTYTPYDCAKKLTDLDKIVLFANEEQALAAGYHAPLPPRSGPRAAVEKGDGSW